jgi:hypothetical protein
VAEGSEEDGSADAEAPRRAEWFGRMLGADWVEVEPGIYEHRPLRLTEPPATPARPDWEPLDEQLTALDEELRESLPHSREEPEPEPPAPGPEPVPRGGGSDAE